MTHYSALYLIFLTVVEPLKRWPCIYFTGFSSKINFMRVSWVFTEKIYNWENLSLRNEKICNLIPLNSATPIRVFFFSCKHNLTQLFWKTCSLFCKSFHKLGYHAEKIVRSSPPEVFLTLTSHDILHYLWSADILKSLNCLCQYLLFSSNS